MNKASELQIIMLMTFLFLILVSCQKGNETATIAFTLQEKDLIPEGITYDPVTGQFFVSSIGKEKVVAISGDGTVSDFITSGRDSIMETLGMKVDQDARRLWVVSNKKIENASSSSVHIYNIDSKDLIRKFTLKDTVPKLFNDLALNSKGDAFITDSYSSKIYKVDADLESLEVFAGPQSFLRGINGIVVSPDDRILYAAAGAYITTVDLETKEIKPIGDKDNNGSGGIDGLVFHRGSLIGIVNAKDTENEMFVVRYELGPDLMEIKKMVIIDKGNPLFNLPTTCTMAGDDLYCLGNTSLRLYFQDKDNEKNLFKNPLVLKYRI